MKVAIALFVGLLAGGVVQAQQFAPKGAKATLTVLYEYSASGKKVDKYDPAEWQVSRTLTLVVPMIADPEQALSQMRELEDGQKKSLEKKQAQTAALHKKLEPTMNEMMKIVEECGDDEACVEKAIVAIGTSTDPSLVQSTKSDVAEVVKLDAPRYQLWRGLSQKGTYTIDESYRSKIADPGCHDRPNQQCSREETRKGGGNVPEPPEAKDISNAQIEFDSVKKNLFIRLPVPFAPLPYTKQFKSDYNNEKSGTSIDGLQSLPGILPPITAAITGDARNLSGTQTIKVDGKAGEGGMLTVKWQFVRQ